VKIFLLLLQLRRRFNSSVLTVYYLQVNGDFMLLCWTGWGATNGKQSRMDNIQEAEKIFLILILHSSLFLTTTRFSSPKGQADSSCMENKTGKNLALI